MAMSGKSIRGNKCRSYAQFEQVVHISAPRSGFTGPEAKPRDSKLTKGRYGHNLIELGIILFNNKAVVISSHILSMVGSNNIVLTKSAGNCNCCVASVTLEVT